MHGLQSNGNQKLQCTTTKTNGTQVSIATPKLALGIGDQETPGIDGVRLQKGSSILEGSVQSPDLIEMIVIAITAIIFMFILSLAGFPFGFP